MRAASMPRSHLAPYLWLNISISLAILAAIVVLLVLDVGPSAGSIPIAQSEPAQVDPFRWG
jgi:hypothetical protein